MPGGGGGGPDYIMIRALEDYLEENGINASSKNVYDLYVHLKQEFQNGDLTIINDKGKISQEFVNAALDAATNSDWTLERKGPEFYIPSLAPAGTTTTTGTSGLDVPPPPPEDDTGLTKAQKQNYRTNQRAGFRSLLQFYGINESANVTTLIEEATKHHYNQATFEYYLRQTPEYRARFVGIFDEDGNLRMNEATYIRNERQYQDLGSRYGLRVDSNLMGWLFTNDVSPSEFADRAPAIKQIKSNPAMYQQFSKALVQLGIAKPGEITKQELLKFALGEGNPEWYKVWNLSRARYVATQAGIQISRHAESYFALNPHAIEQIAKKNLSDEELASGFAAVEEAMRKVLPTQEAGLYGVGKRDLTQAAFGGKGSRLARDQIERAAATADAFGEERAGVTAAVDSEGNFGTYGGQMQRRKA